MGKEARARGTFEERKAQAIEAGRIKSDYRRAVLFRKYDDVFKGPEPPTVRGIHQQIKQPGENRKEHKPMAVQGE